MTIEETTPTPQDAAAAASEPAARDDLETLVRTLADHVRAADERSNRLAERVALLEGQQRDAPMPSPRPNNGRSMSTRVEFARKSNISSHSTRPNQNDEIGDRTRPAPQADANGRSRGVSFAASAKNKPSSHSIDGAEFIAGFDSDNERSLTTVAGVPEDDPEEALADRVLFIERQLENSNDVKSDLADDKYKLPESTFSLLITCHTATIPFGFAVFTIALSITCLILTLVSSVSAGMRGYGSGVPAGVSDTVRAAQFIGAIVGVLMEDEVPQGLQLIANAASHTLLLNGEKAVHRRVIYSSLFRLVVGYLFLASLFINIAQSTDVIEIFYDVLALEFVENIDDTTFALGKRGFFGRALLIAANERHDLEISRQSVMTGSTTSTERRLSFSGIIVSNNRVNHLVRFVYFLNATIVLIGLGIITAGQDGGNFRCNRINVLFDEEIWEESHVTLPNGNIEKRLLIYSYFNGIYEEEGEYKGYPKYVEQNKNDGTSFGESVTPAEIIYCPDLQSWVFRHPDILTSPSGDETEENECSWLWKSPQTKDYDVISTTNGDWEAWIGQVKRLADMSISCMECSERSDCNYHGECGKDSQCKCSDTFFGESCQFQSTCEYLATEKSQIFDPVEGVLWKQDNPITNTEHMVYNRPLYIQEGLSGQPYDMRLYRIREKEITTTPSSQPSSLPSYFPTQLPSNSATPPPTNSQIPDEGSGPGISGIFGGGAPYFEITESPTPSTTKLIHNQIEYDSAPDFADRDDFFESPSLHPGLEETLEDYKVVISYTGSRFYGTITESNATLEDLFPPDYHAFWDQSFDVDRTFIISDTTSMSSPVGVDFFEMRRRINTLLNPNVQFMYGPFGALIPLMDYQGTGFFHCLDMTTHPSSSPSSSSGPTISASALPSQTPSGKPTPEPSSSPSSSTAPTTSAPPTFGCSLGETLVRVTVFNEQPCAIAWTIYKDPGTMEETILEDVQQCGNSDESDSRGNPKEMVCLPDGTYEFFWDAPEGESAYFSIQAGKDEIISGEKSGAYFFDIGQPRGHLTTPPP